MVYRLVVKCMTAATSQKASFRPRRPKDEIEAMLAAHMALTNIALLDLFARSTSEGVPQKMSSEPMNARKRNQQPVQFQTSDSCGSSGENAEGAKQAAPTAEGCSAQTATADRCASSKETTDPRFHRGGEAGRHRGAIRAVAEVAT
jgi:hypothetical protein